MTWNHMYKPGDKVQVRRDLDPFTPYYMLTGSRTNFFAYASDKQIALAGQEFEVNFYSNSKKTLRLKGCGGNWTEGMLELVSEKPFVCRSLL